MHPNQTITYLLLLAFKTSSRVSMPISFGRLVNLLLATWSCLREVREPSAEGKFINLQIEFVINISDPSPWKCCHIMSNTMQQITNELCLVQRTMTKTH